MRGKTALLIDVKTLIIGVENKQVCGLVYVLQAHTVCKR